MSCLPCEKEIIDSGMGIVRAQLYADTLRQIRTETAPDQRIRAVDVATADLFVNSQRTIFSKLAQDFLQEKFKLTKEQNEALMAKIDEGCYRAIDLTKWAFMPANDIAEHAQAWTVKIIAWLDADQKFFTDLIDALKPGKKSEQEK